jgi:hypothetical protein
MTPSSRGSRVQNMEDHGHNGRCPVNFCARGLMRLMAPDSFKICIGNILCHTVIAYKPQVHRHICQLRTKTAQCLAHGSQAQ